MQSHIETAEKRLLREVASSRRGIDADKLNDLALTKALDEGYVLRVGDAIVITHNGINRLDDLT